MCCFVILLLFNEMQMNVRRFSAIPHLRASLVLPEVIINGRFLVPLYALMQVCLNLK